MLPPLESAGKAVALLDRRRLHLTDGAGAGLALAWFVGPERTFDMVDHDSRLALELLLGRIGDHRRRLGAR